MFNQEILRILHCLSYEEFKKLLLDGTAHETYLEEKWSSFRTNLATFLMELDKEHFDRFLAFANFKYEKKAVKIVESILAVSKAVREHKGELN